MKLQNLSFLERLFRIALGAGMLATAWSGVADGLAARGLEVFAWVPLLTGLFGWCPFYALLGLNTRKRRARPEVR